MNKWLYFSISVLLCLGILLVSGADVNHGHGPGWQEPQSTSSALH